MVELRTRRRRIRRLLAVAAAVLGAGALLTTQAFAAPAKVTSPTNQQVPLGGALALPPDHSAVEQWLGNGGNPTGWQRIGGAAGHLYAGAGLILATDPGSGDLYSYDPPPVDTWHKIGGPGKTFLANEDGLYGLTPSGNEVNKWVSGTTWETIGTAATWLYGASHTLLATEPGNGDVWKYSGNGTNWTRIGSAGSDFRVGLWYDFTPAGLVPHDRIYALTPNKDAVYWYQAGTTWEQIGGPASELAAN